MLVYSSDFGNAAAVSSRANEPKRFFALQAQTCQYEEYLF
jgi:hypothetical protein